MKYKILIILNTDYHSEVALSLYGSLELANFEPYIYPIYSKKDHGLIDLLKKYNINFIDKYDLTIKNNFKKAFLVTPISGALDQYNQNVQSPPDYYSHQIIQDFKSNIILILHRPTRNKIFIENAKDNLFNNPKFVGLTPFSQQIGLNYILLSENPIANRLPIKFNINNKRKIVVIGKFFYSEKTCCNRETILLDKISNQKLFTNNDYEIILLGESANRIAVKEDSKIIIKSNLPEIDFYNEIHQSDYILNLLITSTQRGYFSDCTSSNFNHILSFRKPAINCRFSSLVSPCPSFSYNNESEFCSAVQKAISVKDNEYHEMIKNFDIIKHNLRLHNKDVIENLINT